MIIAENQDRQQKNNRGKSMKPKAGLWDDQGNWWISSQTSKNKKRNKSV